MNRADAFALLCEYTQSDSLRKHGLAVEAAMSGYARRFGEDEEKWGIAGLLHDFDYERWPAPADHPRRGSEILAEKGYPEDVRTAILGHADHSGVPRTTRMDHALFAVDELSGFVTAVTLVRPSKSLADVTVSSVRKKLKDRAFARNVSRDDITRGAAELGLELDAHIANVIAALQGAAKELGLDGSLAAGTGAGPGAGAPGAGGGAGDGAG